MSTSRAFHRATALGVTAATAALVIGLVVGLGAVLSPASADEPSSWQETPHVSGLDFLLVLLLIPLALFLVISVLAALPSLIKGQSYQDGRPWTSQGEWFGGPREGVEGADDPKALEAAGEQGGTGTHY